MTELEKVWNFCEQKKNACDKNVEVIGMDNMLTPPWQTNMGMSNAYWSVQKCIEIIEEERKTNADKVRAMSDKNWQNGSRVLLMMLNRMQEAGVIISGMNG